MVVTNAEESSLRIRNCDDCNVRCLLTRIFFLNCKHLYLLTFISEILPWIVWIQLSQQI